MNLPHLKISAFCRKNHIRKMSLFGSALAGKLRSDSDLDFLVEFDPGHIPGLIKLAGMETELERILGRKVDLRTPQDLSRYFRDEVTKVARVQYAKE